MLQYLKIAFTSRFIREKDNNGHNLFSWRALFNNQQTCATNSSIMLDMTEKKVEICSFFKSQKS